MELLADMHELRFTLVEGGHTVREHNQDIEGYRKLNNMLKKPKEKKGDWANDIKVKDLINGISKEEMQVLENIAKKISAKIHKETI